MNQSLLALTAAALLVGGCNCGGDLTIHTGNEGGGTSAGAGGNGGNGGNVEGTTGGGTVEGTGGGSTTGSGDAGVCGKQTTPIGYAPKTPDVIITFDRSGSMQSAFGSGTRYTIERDILKALVTQFQDRIRFGYEAFPQDTSAAACPGGITCCAAPVSVPPALMNAAAVNAALDVAGQGSASQTPTAPALRATHDFYKTLNDNIVERYVLLSTDGQPNASFDSCNSTSAANDSVTEVTQLLNDGVKTIVLGISPDAFGQVLESMARAGGAPRDGGMPSYYPATTPADLQAHLGSIIGGVAAPSCNIDLTSAPPDPNLVTVYFDGVQVPFNSTHSDGWAWKDSNMRTIILYGSYCQSVLNRMVMNIEVRFGCPPITIN